MDIPAGSLTKHDVPVDVIISPTRLIRVPNHAPKPCGIFWDLLSPQKLAQIRVLRQLKQEIEEREGLTLPTHEFKSRSAVSDGRFQARCQINKNKLK